jgi:hypothetical protein
MEVCALIWSDLLLNGENFVSQMRLCQGFFKAGFASGQWSGILGHFKKLHKASAKMSSSVNQPAFRAAPPSP